MLFRSALKKVKDGDNIEEIKKALEEVNTIAQKIGGAMYEQAAKDAESAKAAESSSSGETKEGEAGAKASEDEVVEGEVEENEKEEDKK